jgi:hypothetical protein
MADDSKPWPADRPLPTRDDYAAATLGQLRAFLGVARDSLAGIEQSRARQQKIVEDLEFEIERREKHAS